MRTPGRHSCAFHVLPSQWHKHSNGKAEDTKPSLDRYSRILYSPFSHLLQTYLMHILITYFIDHRYLGKKKRQQAAPLMKDVQEACTIPEGGRRTN